MNDQARRGKTMIGALIAAYFLLELLLMAVEASLTGLPPGLPAFLRLGLPALLACFLYLGRDWARWAWGGLLLLEALAGLVLGPGMHTAGAAPVFLLFSCAGLLYFLGSAVLLFLSPDVRAYLEHQRARSLPGPCS